MRLLLTTLVLLVVNAYSQQDWYKYEVDPNLSDSIFISTDSVYNPMTLVFEDENGIMHYDGVPDSNKYEVNSSVLIKEHWSPTILFCEAFWQDSILVIQIYEGTPAESKGVRIHIYKDKYQMFYEYDTPAPMERKITNLSSNLILKAIPTDSSDVIYGRLSLTSGVYTHPNIEYATDEDRQVFEISGAFRARVKN